MNNMADKRFVLVCVAFFMFAAGCSGAPQSDSALAPTLEETEDHPTPTAKAAPTAAGFSLSPQPYAHPSGAYKIFFPQDWNCSESNGYRVDCQSPDALAAVRIRLINSGARLSQPEFINVAQAEFNFSHAGQRAFNETERNVGDGTISVTSSWMSGETSLNGWDYLERADSMVAHLSFSAPAPEWERYWVLFEQVRQSADFNPKALASEPAYGSTFLYTSPDSLFTIEVPTSWTKFLDTARIFQAQIEQFFSPDQHASIQTVIYRHGALIEQEYKATKTLEILRALYGSGFRVSHDKALPDRRERLAWYVESKQLSGISFFDSWGNSLYIFTVLWDDAYQGEYQPILDRVVESFGYP